MVPEAVPDLDGKSLTSEHYVGLVQQFAPTHPVVEPLPAQRQPERKIRFGVPLSNAHRDAAGGELGGPDFQCFLVDRDVDLAPDPAFGAPELAVFPFPFTLDLDPGAVHQQVQGAIRFAIGDIELQGLLAARQLAVVGHYPVPTDQPQQALEEAGPLPERHPKQNLHRQAGLDRGIAVVALSTTLAGRRGFLGHGGVNPSHGASVLRSKPASS